MSATTSAATGRCFGIQRVCQVWERSRSALYARRARAHHRLGAGPARRGPPPRQSDAQLLAAIRTDLARSPFHGEGHRKVHARLRILDGIRVARTRVLRVMRAHGLLSPHRGRQGAAKTHDGKARQVTGRDGLKMLAQTVNVPVREKRRAGLQYQPRLRDEGPQGPFGLAREHRVLDQGQLPHLVNRGHRPPPSVPVWAAGLACGSPPAARAGGPTRHARRPR